MSKLQVDDIVNKDDTGSVGFSRGVVVTGVMTATSFSGGASGDFSIEDKIVHTGDTNTAIRFPAADTFTVETAGSERIRVDSSGNLGIGTDSPSSSLHLLGSAPKINLQHTATGSQGVLRWVDITGTVQSQIASYLNVADSGNIEFCTGGTGTVMELDSAGRLLLGTTTEGEASADDLTVANSSDCGITIRSGTSSKGKIFFSDGTSGLDESRGYVQYEHTDNVLRFGTDASEAARFDSSQRLLINTTTSRIVEDHVGNGPQGKIQIEATNSDAIMSIISAGTADANRCGTISLGRHRNSTVGGTPTIVQDGDALGAVMFSAGDGTDMRTAGAKIHAEVDGTPGSNDMPGALIFSTTSDGSSTPYNSEALRIDSSQRLLIGADTSTLAGTIQAKTQIVSSDFNAALAIRRNQNSDGAGALIFFKNRGTSNSSNTVVQDDDGLGNIRFFGNDGTDFAEGAAISARVDGTPGSNDMPGALEFKTSADGAESPVVKFTIDSTGDCTVNDGDLVIGTNGHGIDFSADGNAGGMTSELLDDYEEGTFTPTANNFTVSGTTTMTGQYVKIGRQVTIGIKFANTGTIAHGVSCNISALPFSMASGTEAHGLIGMLQNSNSASFNSNIAGTQCKLDGEGGSRFFPGSFTTTSSGAQLLFGGTYIAAS